MGKIFAETIMACCNKFRANVGQTKLRLYWMLNERKWFFSSQCPICDFNIEIDTVLIITIDDNELMSNFHAFQLNVGFWTFLVLLKWRLVQWSKKFNMTYVLSRGGPKIYWSPNCLVSLSLSFHIISFSTNEKSTCNLTIFMAQTELGWSFNKWVEGIYQPHQCQVWIGKVIINGMLKQNIPLQPLSFCKFIFLNWTMSD